MKIFKNLDKQIPEVQSCHGSRVSWVTIWLIEGYVGPGVDNDKVTVSVIFGSDIISIV